jgi:TetR/AcrR family transcriptional regulator, regulator of cefoperazone and chloramphenicol sensitivity
VTFVKGSDPKVSKTSQDLQTRERLIQGASTLFADRGFKKVTVREICRASRANVAAVNYHFGDKAGLYREVVQAAIKTMKETNELGQRAGEGSSPEQQIRAFVRIFVTRLTGVGPSAWIHKLMAREMEEPSEALDLILKQVIQPRMEYLCGVVAAIMKLPAGDPRVFRSVASLHGQCLIFAKQVPPSMAKTWGPMAKDVDAIADHVAEFSIGGMRVIAHQERPA